MKDIDKLLREVKKYYKKAGRSHLPWRQTRDRYKILVSEVMLQQTQVSRVVPFYARFIKKFPTPRALAKAPFKEVLEAWQGLGYNRRAKYLHEAAKIITTSGWQEKLPGVGPYTKAAVEAFAHNKPTVFIETNIRTVFFHSRILENKRINKISDKEILSLIAEALRRSKMQPRDFYAALMDYGAHLKVSGVRLNARSKHYTRQSKFKGSARELRGAILRELLKKSLTKEQIIKNLSRHLNKKGEEIERELKRLLNEGFLKRRRRGDRVEYGIN